MSLISDAAKAIEVFSEDELEAHAALLQRCKNDAIKYSSLHGCALACFNGACNPLGIVNGFCYALAASKIPSAEIKDNLDIKIIVGQLSCLLKESLGPSEDSVKLFKEAFNV